MRTLYQERGQKKVKKSIVQRRKLENRHKLGTDAFHERVGFGGWVKCHSIIVRTLNADLHHLAKSAPLLRLKLRNVILIFRKIIT